MCNGNEQLLIYTFFKVNIKLDEGVFKKEDYVVGNYRHSGFYRVNYDDLGWDLLIKEAETMGESFDELTKTQLLDDSSSLGRAQKLDHLVFIRMMKSLENETRDLPFKAAFIGLDYLELQISNDFALYEAFKVKKIKLVSFYFILTPVLN